MSLIDSKVAFQADFINIRRLKSLPPEWGNLSEILHLQGLQRYFIF